VQSTLPASIKSVPSLLLPGLTWVRWKTSWRRKRMRWAPPHTVLLR
jgi:hypothetical protein